MALCIAKDFDRVFAEKKGRRGRLAKGARAVI